MLADPRPRARARWTRWGVVAAAVVAVTSTPLLLELVITAVRG